MAERLRGKVALVTGGARGLGRSHVLELAREGAAVGVFDLAGHRAGMTLDYALANRRDLENTVEFVRGLGGRALALAGDVRSEEELDGAVSTMVDAFGRVDILVANAGVAKEGLVWEFSRRDWDDVLAVNLTGVWQSCKAVLPTMIKQQSGRVIIISSAAALKAGPGGSAYQATKAGVIALCRSLALEVGPYGITANCVCPGPVLTDITRRMAESADHWASAQAIPEPLDHVDISKAVVYLASDAARRVTGVVFPVDAGWSLT
jgi:NAD(P)-dependent dehydrogenase (short-subunit alcohol dehydrogenase family)